MALISIKEEGELIVPLNDIKAKLAEKSECIEVLNLIKRREKYLKKPIKYVELVLKELERCLNINNLIEI